MAGSEIWPGRCRSAVHARKSGCWPRVSCGLGGGGSLTGRDLKPEQTDSRGHSMGTHFPNRSRVPPFPPPVSYGLLPEFSDLAAGPNPPLVGRCAPGQWTSPVEGSAPPARADWPRDPRGRARVGVAPPPPPPRASLPLRSSPPSLAALQVQAARGRHSALHTRGAPQCSWDGAAGCLWRQGRVQPGWVEEGQSRGGGGHKRRRWVQATGACHPGWECPAGSESRLLSSVAGGLLSAADRSGVHPARAAEDANIRSCQVQGWGSFPGCWRAG